MIGLALWAWLAGCGGDGRPAPVSSGAEAIALAIDLPFAELDIPKNNRPQGAKPAVDIPLPGPWHPLGESKGMSRFEMDLPVRPRGLFFHTPQPGLELVGPDGAPWAYDRGPGRPVAYWNHDREKLVVAFPGSRGAPGPDELHLRWPKAVEREEKLNLELSGVTDPTTFVRTTIQADWDSRAGILVPAPGRVAWDLIVPPAGELHFAPGIVAPEVLDGRPSDGARLIVEVGEGSDVTEVFTADLMVGRFTQQRVDLSKWAGKQIRLRVRTEPKGSPDFDYVFLAEPVVASRKATPTTVMLVFVDTLRRDHMGVYGYERETSKPIDVWAQQAVVFDQARTVAPWTLPSARSVITGRQPEEYDLARTLPSHLREKGWATGMIAGNVYLSPNFDMNRDWDYQHVTNWPQGDEVTAQALKWLDEHEGRDRLLLVHYMDPHLPYQEPQKHRYDFAGDTPAGFTEKVSLEDIKRKDISDEAKSWVIDRYDNNVKYATDEAAKLIATADSDDVVVFFADHGEELWDHRGFEHGHTLFDELLRVPLIVQAPGLTPGRVSEPVSLLDVTPTILDALGIPAAELDGQSLLPLASGNASAKAAFSSRDQAFGRPLYGSPRWGVLHDDKKWTTTEGREAMYDLGADPLERQNTLKDDQSLAGDTYRKALGATLGRDMDVGYRLFPGRAPGETADQDYVVRVTVPGGVKAAWPADDPLKSSEVTVTISPLDTSGPEPVQVATFTWVRGWHGTREAYLVPADPQVGLPQKLSWEVSYGTESKTLTIPEARGTEPGKLRLPLIGEKVINRMFGVSWAFAPAPNDETGVLDGSDDEMKSMLEAMGYTEKRNEDEPKKEPPKAP